MNYENIKSKNSGKLTGCFKVNVAKKLSEHWIRSSYHYLDIFTKESRIHIDINHILHKYIAISYII